MCVWGLVRCNNTPICIWPITVCVPNKGRCGGCGPLPPTAHFCIIIKGVGQRGFIFWTFQEPSTPFNPFCFRTNWPKCEWTPAWCLGISSYPTDRPQYVRLKDITSDTVVSSTVAPQGTVMAPLLFTFTPLTSVPTLRCVTFRCLLMTQAAIVGCIWGDSEEENRSLKSPDHVLDPFRLRGL